MPLRRGDLIKGDARGGLGRISGVRQHPEGGNTAQEFQPDGANPEAAGLTPEQCAFEKDVLPLVGTTDPFGSASFNLNPLLLETIRMSDLFWDLAEVTTFSRMVDWIYYRVQYATPWVPGTHKAAKATGMQSELRGVCNAGTPGDSYIALLKLFIMRLTRPQIKFMLEHPDSPFIRVLALLYLRIGMTDGYKELWSWCAPYLNDKEEFMIDGTPATKTTVGEFVRRILTDQDYFGDRLPRMPVMVGRQIAANLKRLDAGEAPVPIDGTEPAGVPPPPSAPPPPPGAPPGAPMSYLEKLRAEASAEAAHARIAQKRAEIALLEDKVRGLKRRIGEAEAAGA